MQKMNRAVNLNDPNGIANCNNSTRNINYNDPNEKKLITMIRTEKIIQSL